MALTLLRFATPDTNYVAKHNNNMTAIEGAVDGLSLQVQAAIGAAVSEGSAFIALFGQVASIVGKDSYLPTPDGTDLDVAGGYFWRASTSTMVLTLGTTTLPFSGVGAGTYYLQVDSAGAVSRSTEPSEAVYSVVWTGVAFGAITRMAPIVWGAVDWVAAQDSVALGDTFDSLDERLEAGEEKAVKGDLSRTYDIGQLTKGVAGAADVALTGIEANNAILRFTGLLTGNINVSVTLPAPRIWLVKNDTTGAFTLTLKGSAGTGEVVPQGSVSWAYHDGTNVKVIDIATVGGLGTAAFLNVDTDVTLAANSDSLIATQKAVKAYVLASVAAIVDSSPGTLDTLNELAAALADDPNFATTMATALAGKEATANKDASNGYAGLTLFKVNLRNAANTFTSWLTNTATAARTWTMPDASGTVALTSDFSGSNTGDETAQRIGDLINGAAAKATPVDADFLGLMDSAAGNILKKLSWLNVKATLKTYFDTLYATLSQPFDVHAFYPGIPTASAKVLRVPVARAVSFPANFAGAYFSASANATATTVFDVQKNGVSIGSVSIAAGGIVATFTTSGGTLKTLAAGDVLSIIAPVTPDTTLADPGFVFPGTR